MVMNQSGRQKGHLVQLTVSVILAAVILASCSHEEIIEGDVITLYPVFNNEIETTVITRAAANEYTAYTGHRQNIYAEAVCHDGTSTTASMTHPDGSCPMRTTRDAGSLE